MPQKKIAIGTGVSSGMVSVIEPGFTRTSIDRNRQVVLSPLAPRVAKEFTPQTPRNIDKGEDPTIGVGRPRGDAKPNGSHARPDDALHAL
jgi:hypothetical protein